MPEETGSAARQEKKRWPSARLAGLSARPHANGILVTANGTPFRS